VRTDGYDEANCRFWKFCERAQKETQHGKMNILKNTNPMRTCLGLKLDHCGEKLATNRLSQGTATYKAILKARLGPYDDADEY